MVDVLRRLHGPGSVILVFVHGWKHDARSDDGNLTQFRTVLGRRPAPADRPVLGVVGGGD